MKVAELKQLDNQALNAKLLELREEQLRLAVQKKSVPNLPSHRFGQIRKTIARIKTLLTQREGV